MKPFTIRFGTLAATGTLAGVLAFGASGTAVATSVLATGQPNQSCEDVIAGGGTAPGNAANAPGSPFNENGGVAGGVYAGSQPQNSKNPNSVSQYDVACFQVSHP